MGQGARDKGQGTNPPGLALYLGTWSGLGAALMISSAAGDSGQSGVGAAV